MFSVGLSCTVMSDQSSCSTHPPHPIPLFLFCMQHSTSLPVSAIGAKVPAAQAKASPGKFMSEAKAVSQHSLIDGQYDEAESKSSFLAALNEWRNPAPRECVNLTTSTFHCLLTCPPPSWFHPGCLKQRLC